MQKLDFEDLNTVGPGQAWPTLVTNQYGSLGVEFNGAAVLDYSRGVAIPGFARSGTKAIEQCYALEFCTKPIRMDFTAAQARVKLWVGYSLALTSSRVVMLRGFNASGEVVAADTATLGPNTTHTPITVPLEVSSPTANIVQAEVRWQSDNVVIAGLAVDDVEFDTIGPELPCPAVNPPALTIVQPPSGISTLCNRFLYRDVVVSGDANARRTFTVNRPDSTVILWSSQVSGGGMGPVWIYNVLRPGINRIDVVIEDCRGTASRAFNVIYQPLPSDVRIEVLGIEATQAIQDLQHTVPLVHRKRTVVRVYLRVKGSIASIPNVSGTLNAFRPGVNPGLQLGPHLQPVNVRSSNSITLESSTDLASQRLDLNASLNFEIPPEWTVPGRVNFTLTGVEIEGCDLHLPCDGCSMSLPSGYLSYARCEDAPMLRVRLVGVPYTPEDTPGVTHWPRPVDLDMIESWLRRAYPAGRTLFTRTELSPRKGAPRTPCINVSPFPGAPRPPRCFSAGQVNGWLSTLRTLELAAGTAQKQTKFYGVVSDAGGFMRGRAKGIPGSVASGPAGAPGVNANPSGASGWDFDGSYADWYAGHEIGHLFGRHHGEFCGAEACFTYIWTFCPSGYEAYPYPGGFLSNAGKNQYGFDVGDPALGLPPRIYRWELSSDVMTYCVNQWISDFTYNRILHRLRAANPVGNPTGVEHLARSNGSALMMSASLVLNTGEVEFDPFWILPDIELSERPQTSPFVIALKDAANKDLALYPFEPEIDSEWVKGENLSATLSEVVPWVPGTQRIAILIEETEVASRVVTPNAPRVKILYPRGGENLTEATTEVRWEAADADGDTLFFILQYSADGGTTWRVVDLNITESSYVVNLDAIPGSRNALFRVIATDGVNTAIDTSEGTFAVRTKRPNARILSPGDGARYRSDHPIAFHGEAFDMEDGHLEGEALEWHSDVQGLVGTGEALSATLVPGVHTITLVAKDADGNTGADRVRITVQAMAPVADIGQDRIAVVGERIILDGSDSSGSSPLRFQWHLQERPADSSAALINSTSEATSFVPDRVGAYVVFLTITDVTGTQALSSVEVTVSY